MFIRAAENTGQPFPMMSSPFKMSVVIHVDGWQPNNKMKLPLKALASSCPAHTPLAHCLGHTHTQYTKPFLSPQSIPHTSELTELPVYDSVTYCNSDTCKGL